MIAGLTKHNSSYCCTLHQLVFTSKHVKRAVAVLLVSFVLQPLVPAYASEDVSSDPEPARELTVEAEPELESEPEDEGVAEEVVGEEVALAEPENEAEVDEDQFKVEAIEANPELEVEETDVEIEHDESESDIEITTNGNDSTGNDILDQNIVKETDADTVASSTESSSKAATTTSTKTSKSATTTSTSTVVVTEATGGSENSSEVDAELSLATTTTINTVSTTIDAVPTSTSQTQVISKEIRLADLEAEEIRVDTASSTPTPMPGIAGTSTVATSSASTSKAATTSTDNIIHVQSLFTNDANYYQFAKDECVAVESGAFYCGEISSSTNQVQLEDGLVAAPDSDGDMEIFLINGGVEQQLTHNLVDEGSPRYDGVSDTIVWQRLINDRYQIIVYNIETGVEDQLTTSRRNSMEPSRFGDHIVWQEWVEDNWEVMYFNGDSITQLTNTPEHDVAPFVYEELVVWNTTVDGEPHVMMYDLTTKEMQSINDADGAAAQNPRFMLVYDSTFSNGDVVTKGFDMNTGTVVPLQAIPQELPKELPGTDRTGETRALIQSKPTPKTEEVSQNLPKTPIVPPGTTSTTTASNTPATLDLTDPVSTTSMITEVEPALIEDVVIPSTEAATTTEMVDQIEDVIIPLQASSTDEAAR